MVGAGEGGVDGAGEAESLALGVAGDPSAAVAVGARGSTGGRISTKSRTSPPSTGEGDSIVFTRRLEGATPPSVRNLATSVPRLSQRYSLKAVEPPLGCTASIRTGAPRRAGERRCFVIPSIVAS